MTEKPWIRMREIFGESVVPYDAALIIRRAVKRAVAVRDCTANNRWAMVELWAANYLADEYDEQRARTGRDATTSAPTPTIPNADDLAEEIRILDNGDIVFSHSKADDLLVATLRALGYDEAMDEYVKLPKWYS